MESGPSSRDVLVNVREDDFVEYFLFSLEPGVNLNQLKGKIDEIVAQESQDYIWQKDHFELIVQQNHDLPPVVDNEEVLPGHLYGVTHYGDNIEDEWFIVYLLFKLTKSIPGLIARIVDSDGEFLLIEAADHLPRWASPDTCEKRVYIFRGEVHLIPLADEKEVMTVGKALSVIRTCSQKTISNDGIQKAIEAKIIGYPGKVQELLHQTNAYVPAAVAAILKIRPSLIAAAVTAFCHRDPIDMRVCRAMRYFPPETRVMCQVKMTRCLYAMLLHHKYQPDRRTGWKMPPPNSPEYAAHAIGMKIACGFEILVSQCKSRDDGNLANDKGWFRYKQSLNDKNYFRNLLEGSLEYQQLENQAKEYYVNHTQYSQPPLGKTVVELLESIEVDVQALRQAGESLPPPDDDSWMEISSDELDKILTERYGSRPTSSVNNISTHLSSFLEHVTELEGAEHPNVTKDGVPLRPKRGIKKKQAISGETADSRDDDNNRISFDQEAFTCAVQNILDFSVPEDSWDLESEESGMSAYEDELDVDLSKNKTGRPTGASSSNEGENEMKQYMDQMDRELEGTTMGRSFVKTSKMDDSFSDIENFKPVDVDMNALKHILESYKSQMGGAGPASNILGPMGVDLDDEP